MEKTIDRSEDELYNGWLRKLDVRLLSLTHGSAGAIDFNQDVIRQYYINTFTVAKTASILLYGEGGSDGKKSPSET
jgi:hypothetical protein